MVSRGVISSGGGYRITEGSSKQRSKFILQTLKSSARYFLRITIYKFAPYLDQCVEARDS